MAPSSAAQASTDLGGAETPRQDFSLFDRVYDLVALAVATERVTEEEADRVLRDVAAGEARWGERQAEYAAWLEERAQREREARQRADEVHAARVDVQLERWHRDQRPRSRAS